MASPPASVTAQLRRQLLQMMLWILALHGTAIGVYYLAGLRDASSGARRAYTVVWLALTFAIVSVYLRRIRLLRHGGRRRRR